ncbi:Hypothetical predicted protein [Lynx pardinus]|uniref:Uncharacterized protein n=1 Tax=Lynx pardinus TaxID=191816 RepID=A0A485NH72_LYNPA|nr:Hypothetical predicted protein [Lynx pardinus]
MFQQVIEFEVAFTSPTEIQLISSKLTISVFPEYLETAEAPANVLTGRYGQTVPGGSLSPRQLIFQIITYFLLHCWRPVIHVRSTSS